MKTKTKHMIEKIYMDLLSITIRIVGSIILVSSIIFVKLNNELINNNSIYKLFFICCIISGILLLTGEIKKVFDD